MNIYDKAKILVDLCRHNPLTDYDKKVNAIYNALQHAYEDGVKAEYNRVNGKGAMK